MEEKQPRLEEVFLVQQLDIKENVSKILALSLAYDSSLVFIREKEEDSNEFVHLSSTGNVIWLLPTCLSSFAMISSHKVVMADIEEGSLLFVDLKTQSIKSVPLWQGFSFEHVQLQVFLQRSLLCVINYGEKGAWLRYFYFKSIEKFDRANPIDERGIWNRCSDITKLNNHSKVGWREIQDRNEDKYLIFSLYYLDSRLKGHTVSVKVLRTQNIASWFFPQLLSNELDNQQPQNKNQMKLALLFEIADDQYLVKKDSGTVELAVIKKKERYPGYIVEKALFEGKQFGDRFKFEDAHLGGELMVVTLRDSGDVIFAFVDVRTGQTVAFEKCMDLVENRLLMVDWNNQIVIQLTKQQGCPNGVARIVNYGLPPLKQLYLHLLLSINDDLDDDLLQDAVESLVE